MQNTKAQNSKLNLQGKLRLKSSSGTRNHSPQTTSSLDTNNDVSFCKENVKSNSENQEDDSLADFKSPKREHFRKPISNKHHLEADKAKRITKPKSSKSTTLKSRKSNANQPSIESSLLKPQASNAKQLDLKEAVPCPVCLKPFKDDATCTNHMKGCAVKNNVSIKQLLEAKSLQDRQAQERKAIGLLGAPVLPSDKKKTFKRKNFSTGDDSQLQLVLAMSESLYEAEKMVELQEAAVLAGIPSECVKEMNDEECKKTLQSFGFTTSKPVVDAPVNRQRKRKLLAPTILQTRSKEDKDRVLTERIACILTGDDALTQVQERAEIFFDKKTPTPINSKLLKKIEQTDNKLWEQSRLTKPSLDFYVDTLKPHFIKSVAEQLQPVESESTPELTARNVLQNTLNTSLVYEPMELDAIINNQQAEPNGSLDSKDLLDMSASKHSNFELEFVQNFSIRWKEALNDSSASDVVIFVKNNKHIYAHKLVFHMQCSNVLLDVELLDSKSHAQIQNKISWLDTEQISALAFLEFIYSGTINTYEDIFHQKELLQQVEQLARLYKNQSLFSYIREKQKTFRFERIEPETKVASSSTTDGSTYNEPTLGLEVDEGVPFEIQATLKMPASTNLKDNKSYNVLTKTCIDRRITASPDLFDSEEEEANFSKIKTENNTDLEGYDVASGAHNIKGEIDNMQDSDEEHMSSQKTLVNLSRSLSPLQDIHEAVTPPSGRSPAAEKVNQFEENFIFNEQEIAEAVTPKRQLSPETVVNLKQEIIGSQTEDDLCNAVTPEHNSTAESDNAVTPKKLVYVDVGVQLHETATEDVVDESIYTAITPPRQPQVSEEPVSENIDYIKSELTMFIEKVQRKNAKGILDTDSEADTPDNNQKRPKNPFSKKDKDDSYRYLRKDEKFQKAISLLEKDVLSDQQKQQQKEEENLKNNAHPSTSRSGCSTWRSKDITRDYTALSDDEKVTEAAADETAEMSMYSKYKKSTKHDNSIDVYRKQLSFKSTDGKVAECKSITEEPSMDSSCSKAFKSRVFQNVVVEKPKPRIIQDVTLVSNSDEEENPLRTFLRDKGKKKIHKNSPLLLETTTADDVNKKDGQIDAAMQGSTLQNKRTFPPESINEQSVLEAKSKNQIIVDLSVDSDEDGIRDNTTFAHGVKQKSCTRELRVSMSKLKELEMAEKKSEDIDAEISKILQSSQEMKTDVEEDKDESENSNTRNVHSECRAISLSPISIVSSPEACEFDKGNSHNSRNVCLEIGEGDAGTPAGLTLGENGDFDLLAFNDLEATAKSSSNVESERSNVPISSPILSQTRRILRGSQEKSQKSNANIRKLITKSASASNLIGKMEEGPCLQRSSSMLDTPEQNKKSSIEGKDETPPLNYSLLDTPDLQKELKKFGLKPQSRTKAKALLTHIYKETCSQSSASQKRTLSNSSSPSSDEDEPPVKRQYICKTDEKLGNKRHASQADDSCVIAEEMDFDDPDVANVFHNPVSIKDAVFKLIKTNAELYNKVLTYEPLPLESLHTALKQNGFKCKINSLMDVLDEQSVTFQVKTCKGERTKRRK